ncbi:MAG TPA: DNA-3-methyladenine glycosylase I, partial [Prolixibacteraceae bacterium]|nr:DNA-3-methyladenine glycosylase I [Prolixibacteraceae bacterium]
MKDMLERCDWGTPNETMQKYHDEEWGVPLHDDQKLFEFLVLEGFQAGLSWQIVLNKRENFRKAFDDFDVEKVAKYDEEKIAELIQDASIIRNKAK